MDRRLFKKSLVLVVAVLGLTATTAWAAFEFERFEALLNGVDSNGNLTPIGSSLTTFVALENTTNGNVIGTARAVVANASHRFQVYVNNPNFGAIADVRVASSVYVVNPSGCALLVATGTELLDTSEP